MAMSDQAIIARVLNFLDGLGDQPPGGRYRSRSGHQGSPQPSKDTSLLSSTTSPSAAAATSASGKTKQQHSMEPVITPVSAQRLTVSAPPHCNNKTKTMGSMAEEASDMAAAPEVEVADPQQLNEWTDEGASMLDRYKLKEAEELFHKVITHTDARVKERDKNVITSLLGLSEVYSKRARAMRGNELEWHRMYMHAISSKRKAMEYCVNALKTLDNESSDAKWFETEEHKAQANLKVLQDCLIKSLQDRILENKSGQTPMEKLMGINKPTIITDEEEAQKAKALVNMNWLENFQSYVSDKYATKIETEPEPMEDIPEEPVTNLRRSESSESLQEVKPIRKINFDKVQAAIQDLVKQITTDMRHRQIHKDMTPEEKLTLMSPLADNFDLLGTFKKAMYSSENGPEAIDEETEEDIKKEDDASSSSGTVVSEDGGGGATEVQLQRGPDDSAELVASEVLHAAANWRQSQDNLNQFKTLTGSSQRWQSNGTEQARTSTPSSSATVTSRESRVTLSSRKSSYRSPTPTRVHHQPLRSQRRPSLEDEDVLRDIGVLRVWKGYSRENSPDKTLLNQSHYKLESYEEVSPLTEVAGRSWESGHQQRIKRQEQDLSTAPGAAISETELNHTLAHALTSMADRLKRHKNLKEASDLYIYALGIFQKISDKTPSDTSKSEENSLKPNIAHIMQSLGTIKCSQGDFVGGSELMEESINIYGMMKNQRADYSVATTWFQLGSAFMAEQWKESTLYEYIMQAVKQVMEKELKSEADKAEMADVEAESDDEDDDEGDAYWVSTQEAIGCFNHALDILRRLSGEQEGHQNLYVEVLTKLGDCNIMTGNYEHAIKCYEEALYMFKNIIGSTTLHNNAHVLAMLGTTNFLCGNYSKAASMYECAHMLQQHVYGADDSTFEMAFTLSMMGLTFYSMKRFHRSIAWCLKAFELYSMLYKEELMNIKDLQRWFVTESLYVVGYSYSTLSFHDKALHYLGLSKCLVKNNEDIDVKQCVKILKAMADEYTALEDNESAIGLYNEALEMSQALGNESSAAALQNQLLNRMAGVHVNTKEYSTAAMYLQQALDYQKNVENSIKDDLVGILKQLGLTYTLSGDVDRAIECYNDCLDAYQEVPGSRKDEMAQMMGTLGTLYHVKACIQDDNDDMENLLTKAEKFYQDAMNIDSTSSVCVQYANYLYQQAQAGDALLAMLPVVHSPSALQQREEPSVTYNGVEHAVLPEHLQQEIDEMDEVTLETRVFSKFLAILCYKQLKLDKDAEDCLVDLFKAVSNSDVPLNHSILGYAMLEMSLYPEAAECFANAAGLQHDNELALTNYWISLCLWSYGTMTSCIRSIFSDALREAEDEWMLENKLREAVRKANQKEKSGTQGVRDSGYYDHAVESGDDQTDEAWAPVSEITYLTDHLTERDIDWRDSDNNEDPHRKLLHRLMARQKEQEERSQSYGEESFMDRGYTSNECLVERQQEEAESAERHEKWESIRTVYENKDNISPEKVTWESEECETPAVILEMLRQQQELLNREYQVHFDVGIIKEDDEEGQADSSTVVAGTNSTFANMVETPQSILHELERKMVEEQKALEEVSQSLDAEGVTTSSIIEETSNMTNATETDDPPSESSDVWVTTEEVVYHEPVRTEYNYHSQQQHHEQQRQHYGQQKHQEYGHNQQYQQQQEPERHREQYQYQQQQSQQRKREHSPEPEAYEEQWITEEVVVDTPTMILQALHGMPPPSETDPANRQTSMSSTRHIMPMELSPDTETAPQYSGTTHTWTTTTSAGKPSGHPSSTTIHSSADQQHGYQRYSRDHGYNQRTRDPIYDRYSSNQHTEDSVPEQSKLDPAHQQQQTHYQQRTRDPIHSWDSEGNHVSRETTTTYSTTGTTERSVIGGNNNYETHHQVNGDSIKTEQLPSNRYSGRWRTETTTSTTTSPFNDQQQQQQQQQPSRYDRWRTEETTYSTSKPNHYYRTTAENDSTTHSSNDRWSDGHNGNGWSSTSTKNKSSSLFSAGSSRTTSALHESYHPQEEEVFEEVWESSEETIETPPEILALLRAQQMQ